MILCDFHLHTNLCDGADTPEKMAEAAFAKGISRLGFSGHSFFPLDKSSMTREKTVEYLARVRRLEEEYEGKMTVLCGLEKDYFSQTSEEEFDYVIGSVHYIKCGEEYCPVDESPEKLRQAVETLFPAGPLSFAKEYFRTEATLFERIRADVIGHFDLLTKFNERFPLFDTADPGYALLWKEAAEALIPYGKPFEINSGAMSRGWRSTPYPSADILRFLKEKGGHILLSSDSHAADTLCYRFEELRELALSCGFTSQLVPTKSGLEEMPLL